jgi:hypothetical protein
MPARSTSPTVSLASKSARVLRSVLSLKSSVAVETAIARTIAPGARRAATRLSARKILIRERVTKRARAVHLEHEEQAERRALRLGVALPQPDRVEHHIGAHRAGVAALRRRHRSL